ncbi:L,D-transpeptidase [Polyangium spumosum]|uniref:L,D-transpeptidase family protein n=1 Tax=Polyangium spumosum TaxID=889282 RepID=A0A6N7PQ41_9BACT|nr:L,D-transpeptidase [Polyangium spumosum]MRG92204.1 L,D-transpeptidase family protein [Polyangium spumosum]
MAGLACLAALGCKRPGAAGSTDGGVADDAAVTPQATQGQNSVPEPPAPPDKPLLGITAFVTTVYAEPRDTSKKLGYLRVGAKVARSEEPVGKAGCPGGWYEIHPKGFVCAGEDATTDLESPILKAAARRPDLKAALPYRYGFVRAVLPLYLRVPTAEQQFKSEFKLKEHLEWYQQNEATINKVVLGAPDIPIDERGVPIPGKRIGEMGLGKNSQELALGQLLGGETDADPIPFWLEGGKRLIPNISDFKVPEFAIFADRARRFTGLSLIGSFPTGEEGLNRRFVITTDLRLAPHTKVKPDLGSPWHGVELTDEFSLPLAFIRTQGAKTYRISKGKAIAADDVEWRSIHPLVGTMKIVEGVKYYRTKDKRWLSQLDVGLAVPPASFPDDAEKGKKWIEISITNQTFVMWEGKRPIYATLVSTGKAGLDDPKKTTATVRGMFKIRNKHITATMDSNEGSSVGGAKVSTVAASHSPAGGGKSTTPKAGGKGKGGKADPKAPKGGKPAAKSAAPKGKPAAGGDEKIPRKGDGEYGVTRRRGEGTFQLRDVPYIQYFESGYALHAAYWHDVFGTPRSHGCINLSPVDAHRVFLWTDPPVPEGWHAVNAGEDFGEGTTVIIHE